MKLEVALSDLFPKSHWLPHGKRCFREEQRLSTRSVRAKEMVTSLFLQLKKKTKTPPFFLLCGTFKKSTSSLICSFFFILHLHLTLFPFALFFFSYQLIASPIFSPIFLVVPFVCIYTYVTALFSFHFGSSSLLDFDH